MVKVVDTPDCGNAPRRQIIKDLVVAIAEKRVDAVDWTVVGVTEMSTLEQVCDWIAKSEAVTQVRFGAILTHGREGGVDGEITTSAGKRYAFCHVLGFASTAKTAKVKAARTYVIGL